MVQETQTNTKGLTAREIRKEFERKYGKKKKTKEEKAKKYELPRKPPRPDSPNTFEGRKTRRLIKQMIEERKKWEETVKKYRMKRNKVMEKIKKRDQKQLNKETKKLRKHMKNMNLEEYVEKKVAKRKPEDPPEPAFVKWAQTSDDLFLTICLKNSTIDGLRANGGKFELKATADELPYENYAELYRSVIDYEQTINAEGFIELTVKKTCREWWPRLTQQPIKMAWLGIDTSKWRDTEPAPEPKEEEEEEVLDKTTKPKRKGEEKLPNLRASTPVPEDYIKPQWSSTDNEWKDDPSQYFYTKSGEKRRKKGCGKSRRAKAKERGEPSCSSTTTYSSTKSSDSFGPVCY